MARVKFDPALARGTLVLRYKRFLADVDTGDAVVTMHCANTGAMLGCSDPGSPVWYSTSANPKRKYAHSLEIVEAAGARICVNTARANAIVHEALCAGAIPELAGSDTVRREVAIPGERGRFDFVLETGSAQTYVEVKSVTLADDGWGRFPDAVSERAQRHVAALARCAAAGCRAVLLFCCPHTGIRRVTTADAIDPVYGALLRDAVAAGVEVLAYACRVDPEEIAVTERLEVDPALTRDSAA